MFSTSNLVFNIKAGEFLRVIPLTDIASVESSTGFGMGMKLVKIAMTLKDGSEIAFEASGLTFKAAKELASALDDFVR